MNITSIIFFSIGAIVLWGGLVLSLSNLLKCEKRNKI
ncbi:MAG: MetS family NSS transporter small subunit [Sarcina sp.]